MMHRSVSRGHRAALRFPAFFAVFLAASSAAWAEEQDLGASIDQRMKEIFNFNRNAVVKIQSSDQHGRIEGSGFYADSTGTIYTALSVIGDGSDITVCQGVRKMPASLLVADPRTRLALLKVEGTTPFLPIGDSSKLEVSSPLVAIGFPRNNPVCATFGLVAGFDKEFLNQFFSTTHIRANLPVQPGLGGAPALNLKGEVVGIIVAGVDGNAVSYLVPINAAEKMRADYASFGRLKPGYVGISVEPAPEGTKPSRARVANLQPNAPAAQAGIREGDLLLGVGDVAVHSPEDIFDASFYLTAGVDTTITVFRNGKKQQFIVHTGENPYNMPPEPLSRITLETTVAPRN